MNSGKVFAFAFLIGAVLLSTECVTPGGGGGVGGYTTYTDATYGYSFEYPAGWMIMSEEAGMVMIISNDQAGSVFITAGAEEKGEYSYTDPYDSVDAMAQAFSEEEGAQVDGPYHTSVAGYDAAEVFIHYTTQMEEMGGITMEVEYSILAIDGGEVFYNFMLTECLSSMCTQYAGVYDHIKGTFAAGAPPSGSGNES